jgi:hypothetical protein
VDHDDFFEKYKELEKVIWTITKKNTHKKV